MIAFSPLNSGGTKCNKWVKDPQMPGTDDRLDIELRRSFCFQALNRYGSYSDRINPAIPGIRSRQDRRIKRTSTLATGYADGIRING